MKLFFICVSLRGRTNSLSTYLVRFLLTPQKNLSSHSCKASVSKMNGNIRVRIRIQFNASFSGANSGSGKDGWCRKMKRRLVIAKMSVSRFSRAVSRVLRMSIGEKRLNISSVDSGSSQNCSLLALIVVS